MLPLASGDEEIDTIPEDEKEQYSSDDDDKSKLKKKLTKKPPKIRRPKAGVFSVNTSFCRSELELIQHVVQ